MRSSRTRNQTCVPCIGRWILNHCATREVPLFLFKLMVIRFHPRYSTKTILVEATIGQLSFLILAKLISSIWQSWFLPSWNIFFTCLLGQYLFLDILLSRLPFLLRALCSHLLLFPAFTCWSVLGSNLGLPLFFHFLGDLIQSLGFKHLLSV